jgi:hypothetical protein
MQAIFHAPRCLARARGAFASGTKGPPSAPPTVPPIIIDPFNRHTPSPMPSIDPRRSPPGPPIIPPGRPAMRMCA